MESEKQRRIKDTLAEMRDPKGEKSLFEDYLSEVWELLGLGGKENLVSLEALLIEATINITISKQEKMSADKYKEAAQKCDAYLLALGLLDGYYHTNENKAPYTVVDRHKDYLANSDYMALIRPTLKSTDNINIEDAQSKPRRNISQDDTRCRKYLSKYLSTSANCQKCLIDGIKNHTHMVELDGHKKRVIKLPEPCFTLDNFPSATEQKRPCPVSAEEASSESNSSAEKSEASGKTEEQRPKEGYQGKSTDSKTKTKNKDTKDFVIKCSVVALAIIAVISTSARAFIIIHNKNVSQKAVLAALEDPKVDQKPYSILFTNPEEWLPFGKTKNLTVKPEPADATLDGLRCKSEGDNAHIIEILSEPGLHIKAIDESEDSEKCDVEVKAYMDYNETISDVVTIHVIKDGENEPMGTGVIDDKASGNSNQRTD